MTELRRALSVTAMFFFAMATSAALADTMAGAWRDGQAAFADGNFALAVNYFAAARDAGQDGPAVHYNLAVSQYKLQDYLASRQTFALLDERYPAMRALAQYNLGLIAMKQAEPETAAAHFRSSYYLSTDEPKLRAMSSTMLRKIAGETVPASQWLRTISLRSGFDDNVILQDDTGLASGFSSDSPFLEAFGALRGPYADRNGWRFDGGFLLLRYSDAEDFNQGALQAGAVYEWKHGAWETDASAHLATTTLGGDSFDRSTRLTARVTRRIDNRNSLALRVRYDDVNALDSIFNGIEGSRQRIDLRYRWYTAGRTLQAVFASETNDRADPSVSPDRSELKIDYRYAPERGWGFGIGGEMRSSKYDSLDPARDEDLLQLDLSITRQYEAGWQIFAQLLHADNDSSDPVFSYKRNQLSIGVYRFF